MSLIYSDCYLFTDIDFNSKRISHLLERRFKNNSYETSFDFKSLRPEQPSNNAKVSRSLLRYQPKLQYFHEYDDTSSSNSSSDDDDDDDNDSETMASINEEDEDDYLNKLAEWEPANFQASTETDEDEDEEEHNEQTMQSIDADDDDESTPMDICSSSKPKTTQSSTDDLVVTYVHRPPKSEPVPYEENIFDCLPQFDGQVDYLSTKPTKQSAGNNNDKRLDDVVAKIQARKLQPSKTIQIHELPSKSNRFRLTDNNNKHKPVIPSPKKPPVKIDRPKETNIKIPKPIKKAPPRLLSSLLKSNEDAIRPLCTPIPPAVPLIQRNPMKKTQRLQSESSLTLLARKSQDSNKILAKKQRSSEKTPQKRSSSLSLVNKPQLKEHSAKHYMSLAQKEYKHFQKHQQTRTQPVSLSAKEKPKQTTKKISKSSISTIDSLFRKSESSLTINNTIGQRKEKHKKIKPLDIPTKTLPISKSTSNQTPQRSQITSESSYLYVVPSSPTLPISKRPANYFEGCIELDDDDDNEKSSPTKNTTDDDIQEIEKPHYSIAYSIHQREKLLDDAVHSSPMHIQWLINLEHVLLEHISICRENNIQPSLNSSTQAYRIGPTFIPTIIINFLKMFILRNNALDQQETIFLQFGLTSHLRYLLIELPTWNHTDEKDSQNDCKHCHQYSLIMNILFDLLFDLIEYDLCENYTKKQYRSTLIENDYFTRFLQSKPTHKDQYYRIKFVIYFIELLAVHMNKCSNKTQFQFNKNENLLFHSMENFIRQILTKTQTRNQRLAICFNVLELCLLFVNEKVDRIKQMSIFLVNLCTNNPSYRNLFLSEKNLFVDIRLLFINELIKANYSIKLTSIDHIQDFFGRIQIKFNSTTSVDEDVLLLLRSLFSSYADLLHELKSIDIYLPISQKELRIILETEFDLIYQKLLKLSAESQQSFEHMKKSLFSFRLLKCKWNKL